MRVMRFLAEALAKAGIDEQTIVGNSASPFFFASIAEVTVEPTTNL